MINVLLVGAGGFLGAIARYGVLHGVARVTGPASLPWGVLTANVAGSLLIGLLAGVINARDLFSSETRLFLAVGVLGGFTTFSSISNDTLTLLRDANYLAAFGNIALSITLGLAAVAVGYILGRAAV